MGATSSATPNLREQVSEAFERAVAWLLEARADDGWWRDFALAPGPSDEWVTAYTGAALAGTASPRARAAAHDAWRLLRGPHVRAGGWAYNAWTPCDADSTAWALHLADRLGEGDGERAARGHAFLVRHLRSDGGVATYADEAPIRGFTGIGPETSFAGWCGSHICVTAAVASSARYRARLLGFLRAGQRTDGSWPSYWWCDDAYATALAAQALREHGDPGDGDRVRRAVEWSRAQLADEQLEAFATSWCLDVTGDAAAVARLLERQRPDGSSAALRSAARAAPRRDGTRAAERLGAGRPHRGCDRARRSGDLHHRDRRCGPGRQRPHTDVTGAGGTTVTGPEPPAVSAHCLLELLLEADSDPLRLLTRCAQEPGEIVQIPFGRSTGYLLSNPQHVAEVLVAHAGTFSRDRIFVERFSPLLGGGLITADQADWRPQRRAVHAALQRVLPRLAATTVELTTAMLDGYASGQVRDLGSDVAELHWRILSTIVLGDAPAPAPAGESEWEALKAELAARPPCPAHDSVAGALAPATTPERLRDELTTLLFAGRDTSTSALTWTLGALARHADVQERVRAELRVVLGGAAPDAASIRALAFLEHVVRESLRLYPPTVFFTRDADEEVPLGPYTIPAGATVILSPWITHRDARVFPAPLAFRPDRWQESGGRPRTGYFPFGAGPRMCVGRSAALLEIALVVATVLQRMRLTVEPGRWPSAALRTTLSPEPAMPVRVEAVAA